MRVDLKSWNGIRGSVSLDENGVAVGSNAEAQNSIDAINIVEPNTLVLLTPKDGERYLRALPANLRGAYFWAELAE